MSLRQLGWTTLLALALALACAMIAAFAPDRLWALRFWPISLAGIVAMTAAIWTTRRWILLFLLPFFIWPIHIALLLVFACVGFGDCL